MRWVVSRNEDGTYLVGSTLRPQRDWCSMTENEVLKLDEMYGVYGVKDGKISVKGSLQNIVDRYMAAAKLSGLGDCVKLRVRRASDNRMDKVISLQPFDCSTKRLRVYKVPEFVEVIEGMHWFADKVIFSDSVGCIERCDDEINLGIGITPMETEVVLNSDLRGVSSKAFMYSNCTKISYKSGTGMTRFYYRAFEYATSLKSIEFPEGMSTLTSETFHSCTALETVYLPDSLSFMADNCFSKCGFLKSLWLPDNVRVKAPNFISEYPDRCTVRIPVENWMKIGLEKTRTWVERLSYVCMKDCDSAKILLATMEVEKVKENVYRRVDTPLRTIFILLEDDSRTGFEEYLKNDNSSYIEAVKL